MIKSNKELDELFQNSNNYYNSIRNEIIVLLKKINSSFENSSSTYYLSLIYADSIFNSPDINEYIKNFYNINDELQINSEIKKAYIILSVCCLLIASKYNENDPHFPGNANFLRVCNNNTNYNYYFQIDDLVNGEIIVLKLLKYKLNYFSVYHFLVFFFGHGVIFDINLENKNSSIAYDKKQMLEKIYILSREILDMLNSNNYNELLNKKNYMTAIYILIYSIENILEIKIDNNNSFICYYNIQIDNNAQKSIYDIIKNNYNYNNNKTSNSNKTKSFRHAYSTALFNNKYKFNNSSKYSFNNNYQNGNKKENFNNNYINNYIINTINYNQNYNYNYNMNNDDIINNMNNNNLYFNSNIKHSNNNNNIRLNYGKIDEINNNIFYNDKIYKNELRKSFSLNQLQNKISPTEFSLQDNNIFENDINDGNNDYYLNNNNKTDIKKNLFISDKYINNFNNYYLNQNNSKNNIIDKYANNKNISNNISLNYQNDKIDTDEISLNYTYYKDGDKYKLNDDYFFKNYLSTPNESKTTINNDRLKLIQKNKHINDLSINLYNLGKKYEKKNKTKEKSSLNNVIEKTKKIFNINNHDKNTIIINNNININNFIEKFKYNNYSNKNKIHNITSNNYYHKLKTNKNNNLYNNQNNFKKQRSTNYKINYNTDRFDNKFSYMKTNRQNQNLYYNILKTNKHINTYYDYSNDINNDNNINNDYLDSHHKINYFS